MILSIKSTLDKFVARKDTRGSKTSEQAYLHDPCKRYQDLCKIWLQDNGTEKDLAQEPGAETTVVSEPIAKERIQEQTCSQADSKISKYPSNKGFVAQADTLARIQVTVIVAQADSSKQTNESKNKRVHRRIRR